MRECRVSGRRCAGRCGTGRGQLRLGPQTAVATRPARMQHATAEGTHRRGRSERQEHSQRCGLHHGSYEGALLRRDKEAWTSRPQKAMNPPRGPCAASAVSMEVVLMLQLC